MKTFELTQEQINQLAEKKHAKELLQQFIPEAFETKPIVGKWYISDHYLIYYLGNNECNCIKLIDGEWLENIHHSLSGHLKSYRLATEEEVEKALISEAKKRGFKKGTKFNCAKTIRKECIQGSEIWEFNFKENWLSCESTQFIFNNGKWAEIIEETNTFDKDYLDNKITEIHSLLGDIKQYVNQLQNEN